MKKILSFDDLLLFQPYAWDSNNLYQVKKENFFLSFTDACIYLITYFNISKKDYVLIPNFYCPDTVKILSNYLSVAFYDINDDLSINKGSYFAQLKKFSPKIIINYNFTGFSLTKAEKEKLQSLPSDTIIIEDCAHKIIRNEDIQPLTKNHFYIDSIRKYSPFLGSHLINYRMPKHSSIQRISLYKSKIAALQVLMQILGHISIIFNSRFFNDLGMYFFEKQDAIVGTSKKTTSGDILSYYLWKKLDLKKIKLHKSELIETYYQELYQKSIPFIKKLVYNKNIYHQDIYFPLLVDPKIRNKLITYLNKQGILAEALWHTPTIRKEEMNLQLFNSLIVLPLSSFIKKEDAVFISNQITGFLKTHKHS